MTRIYDNFGSSPGESSRPPVPSGDDGQAGRVHTPCGAPGLVPALTRWLQELLGPEASLLWGGGKPSGGGTETHTFRVTLPWRCRHAIHEIDGAENGPHPDGVELWRAEVKDTHFADRALAQATIELVIAA